MLGWLLRLTDPAGVPDERRDRLARVLGGCGFGPASPAVPGGVGWQGNPDGVPVGFYAVRDTLGVRVRSVPTGLARVCRRTPDDETPGLGDPSFDAVVAVHGDDRAQVLRVLGPAERALFGQAVREGWRLVDGEWGLDCADPDAVDLHRLVRRAVALGKIRRGPASTGSGLGARLVDPEPGVRDNALSLLLANPDWADEWNGLMRSDDPRTVLAVAVALRDGDTLRWLGRNPDLEVACDAWLALLGLAIHSVSPDHFEPPMCALLDASRHPAAESPRPSPDVALRWKRILSALAKRGTPAALERLHARSEQVLPMEIRRHLPAVTAAIRARTS